MARSFLRCAPAPAVRSLVHPRSASLYLASRAAVCRARLGRAVWGAATVADALERRRGGVRSGQASYGCCRRRQRAGASVNLGRARAKARHQSRPSGWPSGSRYAGPSRPQRLSPRGPTADCPVGVSDARPCRCQRPAILSHAARRDSVVTAAMRCIMGLPREVSHVFLGRRCNWNLRHHNPAHRLQRTPPALF